TLSTEMYYTGINPETMEPVYVARHPNEKKEQNQLFFFYKPEVQSAIKKSLHNAHLDKYLKDLGIR
ncbi:MAG: hypothetical protein K6A67_10270, partial [Bacteroidales bacterium]|nr:hypothetical protein [Bacteroidales bacterium]